MAGVGVAISGTLPRVGFTETTIASMLRGASDRRFFVSYKGHRIGTHTVLCSSEDLETRINTEIHLLVKVAFFTVFAFSHRSQEIWREGQLMSMQCETVEHGQTLHVEGSATPDGFRVASKGDPFITSAATLTSNSLWTPAILDQETLVDAQHGGIIGVSSRQLGEEDILIGGRTVRATRSTFITPYLAGSIWYDAENNWVHGEFERDGARITYQLDT